MVKSIKSMVARFILVEKSFIYNWRCFMCYWNNCWNYRININWLRFWGRGNCWRLNCGRNTKYYRSSPGRKFVCNITITWGNWNIDSYMCNRYNSCYSCRRFIYYKLDIKNKQRRVK